MRKMALSLTVLQMFQNTRLDARGWSQHQAGMTTLLGIDTGGTYTDAVLYDPDAAAPGIAARAKCLTTHDNLAEGIAASIAAVGAGVDPRAIGLVSISTTLATNALVENKGGDICLILIGFDPDALNRAGLDQALQGNPCVLIDGGHGPGGARQAPLDLGALKTAIDEHAAKVEAFAVVAHFGTRDPVDEIAAKALIREHSGLPVTCGHELTAELGGPKRALTAVLNARLIGLIEELIAAVQATMVQMGIDAPLMIVRGDGSLVSAAFAQERPIETILSGPAASLVGAAHLTDIQDAVVSDIGGTTTDIAVLSGGRPMISPQGAAVGGHRTLVEAVAMTTCGLGGDSQIAVDETAMTPRLIVGPRRVVPLARLAAGAPQICDDLDRQLAQSRPGPLDGKFLLRTARPAPNDGMRDHDRRLLDDLGPAPAAADQALRSRLDQSALDRLVARGLVQIASATPTDAAHVLGHHQAWDKEAARLGVTLLARRRLASGNVFAETPEQAAQLMLDALVRRSAEEIFRAVLIHDGLPASAAASPLVDAAFDGHQGAAKLRVGLDIPLVGLGASAPLVYPDIAAKLRTEPVLTPYADVANAVGAVAGHIRLSCQAVLTQPSEGLIRVHLPDGTRDFSGLEAARRAADDALSSHAMNLALTAGAEAPELHRAWEQKSATVEARQMFIEGTLTITATGRPGIAART